MFWFRRRHSPCLLSPGQHRKASASCSALGLHVSLQADSSVPAGHLMMSEGLTGDIEEALLAHQVHLSKVCTIAQFSLCA